MKVGHRASQRVAAMLPVTWIRAGRRAGCFTGDISAEGMFLRTEAEVEPGSLMHVEVRVPGGELLTMFVRVRFVGRTESGRGIGVQIYVISEDDQRAWTRCYRRKLAAHAATFPATQAVSA